MLIGVPVVVALIVAVVVLSMVLRSEPEAAPAPATSGTTVATVPQTSTTAPRGGTTSTTAAATRTRVFPGPFSGTSGRITLTVEKVEATANQLRVFMLVKNSTTDTITLPASAVTIVDDDGHAYRANGFSEGWPNNFSPGQTRGVVDVAQGLEPGASTLRVGWGTVFGTFEARNGIFVQGVKVA